MACAGRRRPERQRPRDVAPAVCGTGPNPPPRRCATMQSDPKPQQLGGMRHTQRCRRGACMSAVLVAGFRSRGAFRCFDGWCAERSDRRGPVRGACGLASVDRAARACHQGLAGRVAGPGEAGQGAVRGVWRDCRGRGPQRRQLDRRCEVRVRAVCGSWLSLTRPPPHESRSRWSCRPRNRCLATPPRGARICPDEPACRCVLALPAPHASVSSAGLGFRQEGRLSPVGLREGPEPTQLVGEAGRDPHEST